MATITRQIKIGFWAADLALAALAAFFLVKAVQYLLVHHEIKPPPLVDSRATENVGARPKIKPYGEYAHLRTSKLFGALSSSNVAAKKTVVEEKLPETTLDLELLGCVAQSGAAPGFAIIRDKTKRSEDTYTVGDFIVADARVEEIRDSEVVISRAGKRETLSMVFTDEGPKPRRGSRRGFASAFPGSARTSRASGQAIRVVTENLRYINKAKLMEEARHNLGSLLNQFRTSPNVVDGKPSGMGIDAIGSDPLSAQAGIKSGDIIKSINGVRVNSIDDILEQSDRFQNAPEIRVVVERNGRHRTLVYNIR